MSLGSFKASLGHISFRNLIGYAVGLIVFGILIYVGGRSAVGKTLHPQIHYLGYCFLAHLLFTGLSAFRWGSLVNILENRRVTTRVRYFIYYGMSRVVGEYTSWVGGDLVVRPGTLARMENVPFSRGLGTVLFERIFDLAVALLLVGPAILYVTGTSPFAVATYLTVALITICGSLVLFANSYFQRITQKVLSLIGQLVGKTPLSEERLLFYIARIQQESTSFLSQRTMILMFTMTATRYIALWLRLHFLVLALSLPLAPPLLMAVIPIGQIALVAALTPGGLGILEGGWYAALQLAGIDNASIAAFLIGRRVYWLFFTLFTALALYLGFGILKLTEASNESMQNQNQDSDG